MLRERLARFGELEKRILTGVVLAALVLTLEIAGGFLFTGFVLLAAMLMILEWDQMTRLLSPRLRHGGLLYILLPALSLIMLRTLVYPQDDNPSLGTFYGQVTPWPVLHLIAMVAATDIGAYAVGRPFGRHKIAPGISPGKTWEGLAGGVLASMITSLAMMPLLDEPDSFLSSALLGFIVALLAQLGDLFESRVKRLAGVKDSGTILPGHGGVLDRLDGLLFAAPVYLLLALLSGGVIL